MVGKLSNPSIPQTINLKCPNSLDLSLKKKRKQEWSTCWWPKKIRYQTRIPKFFFNHRFAIEDLRIYCHEILGSQSNRQELSRILAVQPHQIAIGPPMVWWASGPRLPSSWIMARGCICSQTTTTLRTSRHESMPRTDAHQLHSDLL